MDQGPLYVSLVDDEEEVAVLQPPAKRRPPQPIAATSKQTTVNRDAVWDLYIGMGVKSALCQLCVIRTIEKNVTCGWQAAHIVASTYFGKEPLTIYYLYPSCSGCNNQCGTATIFDYLWARQRYGPLRKILLAVYHHYVTEHDDVLAPESRMIHVVLEHLYGKERFPLTGGITNKKQIYELAREAEMDYLRAKCVNLERQLEILHKQRKMLIEAEIKPDRL